MPKIQRRELSRSKLARQKKGDTAKAMPPKITEVMSCSAQQHSR